MAVYHLNFVPERLALKVEAEPVERMVTLRAGGNLSVTVTDPSSAPVEGAEVEVLDAGGAGDRSPRSAFSSGRLGPQTFLNP